MDLLRLTPEIQGKILSLTDPLHRRPVTERMLRPIGAIAEPPEQVREFHKILF